MPEARINGARIWYKETGEGDPVIRSLADVVGLMSLHPMQQPTPKASPSAKIAASAKSI
jgi:hypothetical protein